MPMVKSGQHAAAAAAAKSLPFLLSNARQSEYGEDPLTCYDSELGMKMAVVMFLCSGHPKAERLPFTFSVFK